MSNYLFINVDDSVESLHFPFLERSLNRYYDIKYKFKIECKVVSGVNKYFHLLENLERLGDSDSVNSVQLDYNSEIGNLLACLTPPINTFTSDNRFDYYEVIKKSVYKSLVKQFSHAQKNDLVNSPLGVLNVIFYNDFEKNVDSNYLKQLIDLMVSEETNSGKKTILDSFHENVINPLEIYKNFSGMKNEVGLLVKSFNDIENTLNNRNLDEKSKKNYINRLSYLFKFVSEHSK